MGTMMYRKVLVSDYILWFKLRVYAICYVLY